MNNVFVFTSVLSIFINFVTCADPTIEDEELKARAFMQLLNIRTSELDYKTGLLDWAYTTNITDYNEEQLLKGQIEQSKRTKDNWNELNTYMWQNFKDPDLVRQFSLHSKIGNYILSDAKSSRFNKGITDMKSIYSTAKICKFKDQKYCKLKLVPDIENIIRRSNNSEELKYTWVEWRKAVGHKVKNLYIEHVDLKNEAARLNMFSNARDLWLSKYETDDIKDQIDVLMNQIKPLYLQIHAYVRHGLQKKYGDVVSERGPIPAHLLGNMWAQSWSNIYNDTAPYPNKIDPDFNSLLMQKGFDVNKIFKTAEDYFVSLNLSAMPQEFWNNSILLKPKDREIVCHASAWDMSNGNDFRIKQCTGIDKESFLTAHHEMGHIQYYIQYKNLPRIYRDGANPGFHEAIGDTISLSVSSRKHLRKLGIIIEPDDDELLLNNLYKIALGKIVFLPYSYILDLWRWNVFSGNISSKDYNCKWWKYREEIQGIEPPVDRSEDDFDIAAKYHVIADIPYIRYFVSFVVQFQFYKALCVKAGEYVPNDPKKMLHECDIYGSATAGNALGKMLQMGASRPWQDAMEVLTGQRKMDASAILEYFKPLQIWIEAKNKENNAFIGWEPSKKKCMPSARMKET